VIILNFGTLVGGTTGLSALLILSVAAVFAAGTARGKLLQARTRSLPATEAIEPAATP
jgi:hypothetical protein